MSNDPKADLVYAILAMDSYNRGYGAGISGLENQNNITKIGDYLITNHSNDVQNASLNEAFAAGFYAIAYRNGTDTVISYRGTDTNTDSATQGGSDARNGYGLALGATPDSVFNVATRQAELAAEFYQAVTGNTDAQRAEGTVLTGHILYGDLQNSDGDVIADDASNADYFQFAPNTTIIDAQHSDVLTFFGVGLTGGDAKPGQCEAVAANDNDAWPERAFCFDRWEMAV